MYAHVHVYVCMHVCVCVRVCAYAWVGYVWMRVGVHVYMCGCACAHVYAHVACVHAFVPVRARGCACVNVSLSLWACFAISKGRSLFLCVSALKFKGAVSRYSVNFCAVFAQGKNGDCSRKCRGHHTMTAQSAARTASPAKLSRENVVFLEQLSFSAALPCGRHYFSPHKMAAKTHRLS